MTNTSHFSSTAHSNNAPDNTVDTVSGPSRAAIYNLSTPIPRERFSDDFLTLIDAGQESSAQRLDDNINIDTLPPSIRDFIRLQHEISGRDIGQIRFFLPPDTVSNMAQIGSAALEKEQTKKRRIWEAFQLLCLEAYNRLFAQLLQNIRSTYKSLENIEKALDSLEGTALEQDAAFVKEEIQEFKKELRTQKQEMKASPPPTQQKLEEIEEEIEQKYSLVQRTYARMMSSAAAKMERPSRHDIDVEADKLKTNFPKPLHKFVPESFSAPQKGAETAKNPAQSSTSAGDSGSDESAAAAPSTA